MSMAKPALRLGQTQQLTLTPQLRQSIRLLALSTAELELELSEAAEGNPLLEYLAPGEAPRDSDNDAGASAEKSVDEAHPPDAPGGQADAEFDAAGTERTDIEPEPGSDERIALAEGDAEAYGDADWASSSVTAGNRMDSGDGSWEERLVATPGLAEHLLEQVALLPLSPRDREIAAVLVDALDEDGLLRASDVEMIAACALKPPASAGEIDSMRHRLQRLDPTGVASRSLVECLDVQLAEHSGAPVAEIELARRLLREASAVIGRVPPERLARQLGCEAAELDAALARVRRLDPKPGLRFNASRTDYVQPDVVAFRQQGRWQVRLNSVAHPGLSLNSHYARLAQSSNGPTERYLRGCLQEARWLIRSVAARGDTLLRVATWIVRQQSAFLDFGAQAMRPLTLREVGSALDLHESTISRATARKYLATPRGVFELRHFFSAALETETGGTASALAVQALIRKLIEAENPRHPMSDAALAKLLGNEGIAVARRTVAKYREGMRIPSSSERCRHA